MRRTKIEICCGSADDVWEAAAAGADRVELNSALFLGGLTPSVGEVLEAKKAKIEIIAMVRPREGGFCYSPREFETMLADTRALLEAGADGIAFGILKEDGSVDEERCARMVEIIGGAQSVFHRAIDVTPDWRAAFDILCRLGIRRVLTSGQAPSAEAGAATIRQMVDYAADRVEILPGGGIRAYNIKDILQRTACTQAHLSMRRAYADTSCRANPKIHFGGALYAPEDICRVTDAQKVRGLLELLD